jgi:hypothetical protein
MSKVGDVTTTIGCISGAIIAAIWVRNLLHDRWKILIDPKLELKIEKHFAKRVEFAVTIRNIGRRAAGIDRVLVKGEASWFPDTAKNPFLNGDFSLFEVGSSDKAVLLGENESTTFTKSFETDRWNNKARNMKALVRMTDGRTKSARFRLN